MSIEFGTKAETLERLRLPLQSADVLPQLRTTVGEWRQGGAEVVEQTRQLAWLEIPLVVRSSAIGEDSLEQSMAGKFLSILDVRGEEQLKDAIEKVIENYTSVSEIASQFTKNGSSNQVLIQPMLENVSVSGVIFSREPNTGADYIVINYDDTSGSTESVTSGTSNDLKTYYHFKQSPLLPPKPLDKIVQLVLELEQLLNNQDLDIEFAITESGQLYLLQVRPMVDVPAHNHPEEHATALSNIAEKIDSLNRPHPYLFGERTIFGVMPDWNPAEIIGIRPKPLALSLYKEIVTDSIWAYQRNNYGYKNLRSFPLLIDFAGIPYIDVRVSFNSFLPGDLDVELSEKLVNYYVDRLIESPSKHDKVEFEIIHSCYTLNLPERLEALKDFGFNDRDLDSLSDSLRVLTNRIIHGETGLWKQDIKKIELLQQRKATIEQSQLGKLSRLYWLLEDCKRYGTLPFAGLARAGFIAVQLLRSLIECEVITPAEYENFMNSLETVSSRMSEDLRQLSKAAFLEKYGHLRPGTYDILSPRYDKDPDRYFDWNQAHELKAEQNDSSSSFVLSLDQLKKLENLLREHQLDHDVLGLFDFIKGAIEGREFAKFVFTQSLSTALTLFEEIGAEHGFSVEDCAFADISCIKQLYASCSDVGITLEQSIASGKDKYHITEQLSLPALLTSSRDVWGYQHLECQPNFVTLKKICAPVKHVDENTEELEGAIVMIPSADPGFDWIFSRQIAGFVTMYGGTNSHMAIRAAELGVPAVIGAGETFYNVWAAAQKLELDCSNKTVHVVRN